MVSLSFIYLFISISLFLYFAMAIIPQRQMHTYFPIIPLLPFIPSFLLSHLSRAISFNTPQERGPHFFFEPRHR